MRERIHVFLSLAKGGFCVSGHVCICRYVCSASLQRGVSFPPMRVEGMPGLVWFGRGHADVVSLPPPIHPERNKKSLVYPSLTTLPHPNDGPDMYLRSGLRIQPNGGRKFLECYPYPHFQRSSHGVASNGESSLTLSRTLWFAAFVLSPLHISRERA